jgi:hypothetical protein
MLGGRLDQGERAHVMTRVDEVMREALWIVRYASSLAEFGARYLLVTRPGLGAAGQTTSVLFFERCHIA